jgi:Type IIB DNA topoisomerase
MPPKRKQPSTKRRKSDDDDDEAEEVDEEEVAKEKAPAPTRKKVRKVVPLAKDADQVLQKCRALKAKLRANKTSEVPKATSKEDKVSSEEDEAYNDDGDESFDEDDVKAKMLSIIDPATNKINSSKATPDTIPSINNIIEVSELKAKEVLEGMETLALRIANQVLTKQGFSMVVPSRAASNQIYIAEWDRIVLGNKCSSRNFLHVKDSRKTAITLRVMHLLHAVLTKRIHITKRDLFYTDVKLFVNQMDSDGVLDDVATMIGCTRSNLNVVASDKGLVVGRIQFEEDGDYIDCTKMG